MFSISNTLMFTGTALLMLLVSMNFYELLAAGGEGRPFFSSSWFAEFGLFYGIGTALLLAGVALTVRRIAD